MGCRWSRQWTSKTCAKRTLNWRSYREGTKRLTESGKAATAYRLLFSDTTPLITQAVELEKQYPGQPDIQDLLAFMRASIGGKFGRARENLRGKAARPDEEEVPQHVSGP